MVPILAALLAGLAQSPLRLEAEDAQLFGPKVSSERPGFSGKGYVTDFTAEKARVVWKTKAKAGIYRARIGFSTPGGHKGYGLSINGYGYSGMFPDVGNEFKVHDAGRVEMFDGENEIAIERGWGYYDLDFVEFVPAGPPPRLLPVPKKLSDPQATPATRKLFNRMVDLYGKGTFAGQFDLKEANYIRTTTGRFPAILGGDFMDYSPSRVAYGSKPLNLTEQYVSSGKAGSIITLSWHWNAPTGLLDTVKKNEQGQEEDLRWYRGFYTNATTFDVKGAMDDPSSEGYKLILRDIDAIAVELRKLADANVPVLWRPLHEAEGKWFWWGAKGADPAKKLWRLMHDRLTNHHRLHNLIWVWNSEAEEWYPGDDVVDIMSIDAYPSDRRDPLASTWDRLVERFNGRKMLALAEFPGAPDVDRMWRFGVRWSHFVTWTGSLGPKSNDPEFLKRVYTSKNVITQMKGAD